jgi:hypothetical protein
MAYDPKYKLRHKPPSVGRLLHYKWLPPRMVGDPCGSYGGHCWRSWEERCKAVYAAMIAVKHGAVPPHQRRGLWFYEYTG